MSPQNSVSVEIVSIGSTPTRVVRWEAEGIEVLGDGDDGGEIVVVAVGRRGKACLDQSARQSYGVRRLEMQAALEGGDDRRRNVGPIVCRICFPIDDDDGWRSRDGCCCICYGLEACFVSMQDSIPVEWCRQRRRVGRMPLPRLPHLDSSDRATCQVLPLPDIASSNSAMTSVADAVCELWIPLFFPPEHLAAGIAAGRKPRCYRDRRQRLKFSGKLSAPVGLTQNLSHRKSLFGTLMQCIA